MMSVVVATVLEVQLLAAGGWPSRLEKSPIEAALQNTEFEAAASTEPQANPGSLPGVGDRIFFDLVIADGCPPGAMFSYLTKHPQDLETLVALKPVVIPLFFTYLTQVSEVDINVKVGRALWENCVETLYRPMLEYLESHPEYVAMAREAAKSDAVRLDLDYVLVSASMTAGCCVEQKAVVEVF